MATKFDKIPLPSENVITINKIADRIHDLRQDDLKETPAEKLFSVTLYNIDESLGYYLENVILPTVTENGEKIKVPVLYGTQERWSSMKQQGFYRDASSKIILPLIMYKRTTIDQDPNLIFPRVDEMKYTFQKKWDKNNRYDQFAAHNKIQNKPVDRYISTSVPNYVVINYQCILWTSFNEQLSEVIEQIMFRNNAYWGDKDKFMFMTKVGAIESVIEMTPGQQRIVRAEMSFTVNGYLLPENAGNKMTSNIELSPIKIKFEEKVT